MLVTLVILLVISAFWLGWFIPGKHRAVSLGASALITVTFQMLVSVGMSMKYIDDIAHGETWMAWVIPMVIAGAVFLGYLSYHVAGGFRGKSGYIIGAGLFLLGCAIVFVGLSLVGWGVANEDLRQLATGMVAGSSGVVFFAGGLRNLIE